MVLDFQDSARHETRLRIFHEAMVEQLRKHFGDRVVEPHSAEVDAETLRRYAKGGLSVWPVIAAAAGTSESSMTELQVDVRWAIFVVVGSWRVAGTKSATAKKSICAAYVADSAVTWISRLVHRTRWGIAEGWVQEVQATDIRVHNLGVGLKSDAKYAEAESLGLFVVWGSQPIDLGPNVGPGDEQLPLVELILGGLEDQIDPDKPSIPVQVDLTFSAARGWWSRLWSRWRRWWFGADVAELAAARMNAFVRRELANG